MSEKPETQIGAVVTLTGVVVGRSEFSEGPPSYYIEYERRGKPVREWFLPADFTEADYVE